jgi:hypothetical protein
MIVSDVETYDPDISAFFEAVILLTENGSDRHIVAGT